MSRKHLRQQHEGQKTLILGSSRPLEQLESRRPAATADSYGLDLTTLFTPRLLLPKGYCQTFMSFQLIYPSDSEGEVWKLFFITYCWRWLFIRYTVCIYLAILIFIDGTIFWSHFDIFLFTKYCASVYWQLCRFGSFFTKCNCKIPVESKVGSGSESM